jgi:hypothetical protein
VRLQSLVVHTIVPCRKLASITFQSYKLSFITSADIFSAGKNQKLPGNPLAAFSDISQDVTKNVFYWSRVAVVVAQGSGMHRR